MLGEDLVASDNNHVEFILGGSSFILEGNEGLQEFMGEGSRAVLVDGHYIVADHQTFLVQDSNLAQFYINENGIEEQQTVIYYENEQSNNDLGNTEAEVVEHLDDTDGNVYPYKKIKLESQFFNYSQLIQQPEEEAEENCTQYAVLQDTPETPTQQDEIDLSKITGKDLTTGETVTLHSYMENLKRRMHAQQTKSPKKHLKSDLRNLLDKKISIGTTKSGKKIVGKIIHVEKKQQEDEQSVKRENEMSQEDLNEASTIIVGLLDVDSVKKTLENKNVIVKYVKKNYDDCKKTYVKHCNYGYGFMEKTYYDVEGDVIEKWDFVQDKDTEYALTRKMSRKEAKYPITTILSIHVTIEKDGTKSIRANLNPSPCNLCTVCNQHFKVFGQFREHLLEHHVEVGSSCQCNECTRMTSSSSESHLSCPWCDRVFDAKLALMKHLKTHARTVDCDVCGKCFKTPYDLSLHVKVHAKSGKEYFCGVCRRTFTRHSNLLRHMVIHKGDGALYRCEVCDCAYNYVSSLTRHILQSHVVAEDFRNDKAEDDVVEINKV